MCLPIQVEIQASHMLIIFPFPLHPIFSEIEHKDGPLIAANLITAQYPGSGPETCGVLYFGVVLYHYVLSGDTGRAHGHGGWLWVVGLALHEPSSGNEPQILDAS